MYEDFQEIIDGAGDLTDTSSFSDIDTLFEGDFKAPAYKAAEAGIVDNAQVTQSNARAGASAKKKEIEDKIKALEDKFDPAKYAKVVNIEDGGFDFFDGAGDPISAIEYAKALGRSPLDVLKDSGRNSDTEFAYDYGLILELNVARETGDYDRFFEKYEELNIPETKENLMKLNNDQMLDLLFQQYPEAVTMGVENPAKKTLEIPRNRNMFQGLIDQVLPGSQFGASEEDAFLNTFPSYKRTIEEKD